MKASELKVKNKEELASELADKQKELFSLRLKKNISGDNQVVRTHSFKEIRRHIARIKTILNEKKREAHE